MCLGEGVDHFFATLFSICTIIVILLCFKFGASYLDPDEVILGVILGFIMHGRSAPIAKKVVQKTLFFFCSNAFVECV